VFGPRRGSSSRLRPGWGTAPATDPQPVRERVTCEGAANAERVGSRFLRAGVAVGAARGVDAGDVATSNIISRVDGALGVAFVHGDTVGDDPATGRRVSGSATSRRTLTRGRFTGSASGRSRSTAVCEPGNRDKPERDHLLAGPGAGAHQQQGGRREQVAHARERGDVGLVHRVGFYGSRGARPIGATFGSPPLRRGYPPTRSRGCRRHRGRRGTSPAAVARGWCRSSPARRRSRARRRAAARTRRASRGRHPSPRAGSGRPGPPEPVAAARSGARGRSATRLRARGLDEPPGGSRADRGAVPLRARRELRRAADARTRLGSAGLRSRFRVLRRGPRPRPWNRLTMTRCAGTTSMISMARGRSSLHRSPRRGASDARCRGDGWGTPARDRAWRARPRNAGGARRLSGTRAPQHHPGRLVESQR